MDPRAFILQETNWKTVKATDYQVAILPWGATEAHNYHLPYGTDNIQNDFIAAESAKMAWDRGAKVIVLPNIPFGVNCQQLDIKLTINLNPSTQFEILKDIVSSLYGQGIKKLLVLNGHGGNDFKQMIRELSALFPHMFICQVHWFMVDPHWDKYFEDLGDHAGEMETSIMMKIAPSWVLPLEAAGSGKAKKLKYRGRKEGWLWAPREWTKVTDDTGIGDPARSAVEKGEAYLSKVISKISDFLVELSETDSSEKYID
ncbi:MAG: creatininase family protein [Cyclobacteriaceae bacterium]|nr:creatininase family protein [Cyclobacteriaceae bacterium]